MRSLYERSQRGVGYLYLLVAVFVLSLGAGKAVEIHATSVQRQQEADLIEIGNAYRQAIQDYYLSSPVAQRQYPAHFEDLLRDSRHLVTRRYLRRLYLDPLTSEPWVPIISPLGGISGVASSSLKAPISTLQPPGARVPSKGATRYRDWEFVYDGERQAVHP